MRRLLITGGAGFIGSNFIRHLLTADEHVQIVNLDLLTYAGSIENLRNLSAPDRYTFVEGDVCDVELAMNLLRHHNIDTIVHFAAETHVDRSILGPAPFIRTNVEGTFSLLEAARRIWLEDQLLATDSVRFHHVSTDEVFGSLGPSDPAFVESSSYVPSSPYAASKAASDHLVRAYAHTYGLPITISNCSNNYGPQQFPEKLIPLVILSALEGKPIPIYGDGQQVRDWLYVEDHCDAIHLVLERGQPGNTYNIGGENQLANLEVVKLVCSSLDDLVPDSQHVPHSSLIAFVHDRPGHDRRYAMDIGKISQELGWSPRETLESGIRKTVKWYLANQKWIDEIRMLPSYEGWHKLNYASRGESG